MKTTEQKEADVAAVDKQAYYAGVSISRVAEMLVDDKFLRPTKTDGQSSWKVRNRANKELRDLMMQARRDLINLEKLMREERELF